MAAPHSQMNLWLTPSLSRSHSIWIFYGNWSWHWTLNKAIRWLLDTGGKHTSSYPFCQLKILLKVFHCFHKLHEVHFANYECTLSVTSLPWSTDSPVQMTCEASAQHAHNCCLAMSCIVGFLLTGFTDLLDRYLGIQVIFRGALNYRQLLTELTTIMAGFPLAVCDRFLSNIASGLVRFAPSDSFRADDPLLNFLS